MSLIDVTVVLLLLVAAAIAWFGGFRDEIGGVRISARDPIRPAVAALVLLVLRHAFVRRRPLHRRVLAAWWSAVADLRRPFAPDEDEPGTAGDLTPKGALRRAGLAFVVFVLLTVLMTWPQAAQMYRIPDPGDPLFSTWRLAWIAHQLPRDPLHLFDGNIFHPERFTLAFSDSVLLPGLIASPLLWVGLHPLFVYNVVFLGGFVLSGAAMCLFVWSLTRLAPAGFLAGTIFAFCPYRFAHYSHLELQFAFAIPLAAWSLRRTIAGGRLRDGLLTGAAVGAQALSCLYYAVFLVTWMAPVWLALSLGLRRLRASLAPLALGAALAALLVAPLAPPYLANRASQGERGTGEMTYYSGAPEDYALAHRRSALYGTTLASRQAPERELFPGVLVVLLALVGMWPPLSVTRLAAVIGLLVAFEASLGMNGFLWSALYEHLLPYRGLRVPARFAMLVYFGLAWLAGHGLVRLAGGRRPPVGWAVAAALSLAVMAESRPALTLEPMRLRPPAVYRWFEGQPPAVIIDLPFPADGHDSDEDAKFMYFSTFHWQTLVNGNSGLMPASYLALIDVLREFPGGEPFDDLRRRGVQFIVVHEEYYGSTRYDRVIARLEASAADVQEVTRSGARGHEARIYRVLP